MARSTSTIEHIDVRAFEFPTEVPHESDGTATWHSTTLVLVELAAGGARSLGYSYIDRSAVALVEDVLAPCLVGADAFAGPALAGRMLRAVRNHGSRGVAACAIAAVDIALWDLRARLLDAPIANLMGHARGPVPVYASGGFTSTPLDALAREIERYVAAGHTRMKIKIGRPVAAALERARIARAAAGTSPELMVDGHGAFDPKEAIGLAAELADIGVVYFEEPVSSDDLEGLHLVRERSPIAIAAGEYAYDPLYVRRMLEAGAVDIQQVDATRCLGFTGFLQADAICDAFARPLSAHCAPALHVYAGAAARRLVHVEQFYDHVRIEDMLFTGTPHVERGTLVTSSDAPGLGLALRPEVAARFAVAA